MGTQQLSGTPKPTDDGPLPTILNFTWSSFGDLIEMPFLWHAFYLKDSSYKKLRIFKPAKHRPLVVILGGVTSFDFPSRDNTASIRQDCTSNAVKTRFFQPILMLLFCICLTFVININKNQIKSH